MEPNLAKLDIRRDRHRLELVKAYAAKGFYDRTEVIEITAGAVIKSPALHLLLDRYDLKNPSAKAASGNHLDAGSRLDEIRRRIEDGFYDDPNNLAELAEKIIKKLGLE